MKTTSTQADLDGPLVDYAAKGSQIELAGMEQVEGRVAYKLKLTLKGGQATHVWIDAKPSWKRKWTGSPGGWMEWTIRWKSTFGTTGR
jgi:hypothetical protein